jgi:predicted transcriptional regulator of viral defense system
MNGKQTATPTLGPISARFISELKKAGKTIFTLNNAIEVYGKEREKTIHFLKKLVNRNVLHRIKPGVYMIAQMGQEKTQMSNWAVIARELVIPDNYYISHYSAMRLHGMTTHPLLDVYIAMTKRRAIRKISNITYHFIYAKPKYFWGTSTHWLTKQEKVMVSDLEKTILDGLERPDLCGGLKEVLRGIWVKQNSINWRKMLQYTKKYNTKAAVKRLGYILEIINIGEEQTSFLLKIISPAKDYILLDPQGPRKGKHLSRWHIRLNMNIDELKASIWS